MNSYCFPPCYSKLIGRLCWSEHHEQLVGTQAAWVNEVYSNLVISPCSSKALHMNNF